MEKKYDFTSGKILPKLVKFLLPILGALVLQAAYCTVDTLVCGRFGSEAAISGVTTGCNIINLFVFTMAAFSTSLTILMGNYIGSKQYERVSRVIGAGIVIFTVLAILFSVSLVCLAVPIATLMKAPVEAFDLTVQYIRICGGGLVFILAYNFISAIFRGVGDSKLPLLFVGIATIVNIGLDLLFVAVFKWDVAGAAFATVIAQAVSVILSIIIIKHRKLPFKFNTKDIRFNEEVKNIFRVGWPLALQDILVSLSFSALNAFINKLGIDASNGYGVANRITQFVLLVPDSLLQSMAAFISQNVGAKKEKRAIQSMACGMALGSFIGLLAGAGVYFFGDSLARIFTTDTKAVEQAFLFLKGFATEGVLTSFLFCFIGYFNAHNKTVWSMVQSVMQTLLVRLPLSYLFSIQADANLLRIGSAMPLSTLFGILINAMYLLIFTRNLNKNNINSVKTEL